MKGKYKDYCSYHLCKKKGKTYKCPYCEKYYCSEHKHPKMSGMPSFKSTGPEAELIMQQYRRNDAHPCPPFYDEFTRLVEKQKKSYKEALDILLKKGNVYRNKDALSKIPVEDDWETRIKIEKRKKRVKVSKNLIKWLIIAIIILIIGFFTIRWFSNNYNSLFSQKNWSFAPGEDKNKNQANTNDNFLNSTEMHWEHMPLTYAYDNCSSKEILRITQAMDYINNKTKVISFEKAGYYEADITFICVAERKDGGFVAGEAENSYYVGTNLYAPSKVFIYPSYHCLNQRPTIEIHEILHLFGLEHATNNNNYMYWDNIMNPYATRCTAEISAKDLNYLIGIYGK